MDRPGQLVVAIMGRMTAEDANPCSGCAATGRRAWP